MALFNSAKPGEGTEAVSDQITTIIASGTIVDGPITTRDGLRVDGTVNSNIISAGSLIVGQEGKIIGSVTAANVYLAGEVQGSISASSGKVEISDTGKLTGDLAAKTLVIDENAVFQGQCNMTSEKTSAETAKERAAATNS